MSATVVVFTQRADKECKKLTKLANKVKESNTVLHAIDKKIDMLKSNVHCGQQVVGKMIPVEYIREYRIENLYRMELPNFWRMLYTLAETEEETIAFIIDILDHKRYSRKFGYKR